MIEFAKSKAVRRGWFDVKISCQIDQGTRTLEKHVDWILISKLAFLSLNMTLPTISIHLAFALAIKHSCAH